MKIYNVILSGGVGSRLWPLSRKKKPKQFLKLFSGRSLFELTAERNFDLVDQIMVVGNKEHIRMCQDLLSEINIPIEYITESQPRNTAAAIAFAALAMNEDDIMIVTPSDHLIQGEKEYAEAIKQAIHLAQNNAVVTFGIIPDKPETGYGYIEYNENQVFSFREKPDMEIAKGFLKKGNFLWNSGMFCFKAGALLKELKLYQPKVYEACLEVWSKSKAGALDNDLSLQIPSISIDYAVMECSDKIKVVPARFGWNDLGSFEALYDYLQKSGYKTDEKGNMIIGTKLYTAFIGLQNTILVVTEDAILALQKEYSQDVKNIYNQLEEYQSDLT